MMRHRCATNSFFSLQPIFFSSYMLHDLALKMNSIIVYKKYIYDTYMAQINFKGTGKV